MKINISIITWVNRILIIPFLISLLLFVDSTYLFYPMYIAFVLGCFQFFSSLITLFYHRKIKLFNLILIYVFLVVLYFFCVFLFFEFERHIPIKEIILIIFWIVPILLSLFWTYILESLNKEL